VSKFKVGDIVRCTKAHDLFYKGECYLVDGCDSDGLLMVRGTNMLTTVDSFEIAAPRKSKKYIAKQNVNDLDWDVWKRTKTGLVLLCTVPGGREPAKKIADALND
jgi:hypothetical protein